jgi:hypothetical protein
MESSPSPTEFARLLEAEESAPTFAALPSDGRSVEVLTLRRRESRWTGQTPPSFKLVPNKPALDFEGQPSWAEIIVVRLLERGGWQAAWAKNWAGRAFWRDVGQIVELAPLPAALYHEIAARTASSGGCWDVIAWRGDNVLFIESKQRKRDRLRPTQTMWLESALACGVPLSAFAVVEWST